MKTFSTPFEHFAHWYKDAEATGLPNPEAMALASTDSAGQPSVRIVLFKGFQNQNLTFYTNYESRKGQEILAHPKVSSVFFWTTLDRQVRVEGLARKMSRAESETYFAGRPRGSQIGAWASRQSTVIEGPHTLEERVAKYTQEFSGKDVPCPPYWGGFLIEPRRFEFWQGKTSRLHDRLIYEKHGDDWQTCYLSP